MGDTDWTSAAYYIGKSQWATDDYLDATIKKVRVCSAALPTSEMLVYRARRGNRQNLDDGLAAASARPPRGVDATTPRHRRDHPGDRTSPQVRLYGHADGEADGEADGPADGRADGEADGP